MTDLSFYGRSLRKRFIGVRLLLTTAALACGVTFIGGSNFEPEASQKIDPAVWRHISKDQNPKALNNEVLIKVRGKADLSAAAQFQSREERGQYVFTTLTAHADQSQADLVAYLREHAISFQAFYITNLIAASGVSAEQIRTLSQRPDVEKIYANPQVKMSPPIKSPELESPAKGIGANITKTGADQVWSRYHIKGAGIVIANQDTGMQWDHPALKAHYRGWNAATGTASHDYNWHDAIKQSLGNGETNKCGYNLQVPCDDDQHGSHTTGTVIGDDGGDNKIGMAPEATWIGCRNMDSGIGKPSSYIDCFEFFLAPYPLNGDPRRDGDPRKAPHVINNSWGCSTDEGCSADEIVPVLEALKAAGIFVVASAGNDGSSCSTIKDPPAYHSALTFSVGAFDHRSGTIASFSSRGPSTFDNAIGPDVSAPGVSVRSSVPGGAYDGSFSGTSMAGPHVVGAVALLWSADRSLIGNIEATSDVLRNTSDAKTSSQTCGGVSGSARPNNTYGYGNLNILAAVQSRLGM